MLAEIPFLHNVLDIPYSHHERWDGKGYPEGLKGEEIPLAARIFTIADFWDSLCSDRPYRKAWPKEKAMAYIRANSGIIFDPKVVEAFVSLIEKTETSKLSKQPLTTL
jgi:HD-GYP domain-containing protein (c-di-GMP phosphodiesterase class II)